MVSCSCRSILWLLLGLLLGSTRAFVSQTAIITTPAKQSPTPSSREHHHPTALRMSYLSSAVASVHSELTKRHQQYKRDDDTTTNNNTVLNVTAKRVQTTSQQYVSPVEELAGPARFLQVIRDAPRDALVVMKFHAHYCKVCQRIKLKFHKMAMLEQQRIFEQQQRGVACPPQIIFASIEATTALGHEAMQWLGVTRVPFVQIYRNGHCVASFSTGPAHNFQKVVGDTLRECRQRDDAEWKAFAEEFAEEIAQNQNALQTLQEQQCGTTRRSSSRETVHRWQGGSDGL